MFIDGSSLSKKSAEFNITIEYKNISEKYYDLLKKQKDNAEFLKVIFFYDFVTIS